MEADSLERLTREILTRPKYGRIDESLVRRVAAQELERQKTYKEAGRSTRARLHQVAGSFLGKRMDFASWAEELGRLPTDLHAEDSRAFCIKVMRQHVSTGERLPILEHFFRETISGLDNIQSVLDCACGLNPLALAWMPFRQGIKYSAVDIFPEMTAFIQKFFDHFHVDGAAKSADLTVAIPNDEFDLALVLKTLPCLEQIEKGRARQLLEGIHARHLLVSYPNASLGGHDKGMLKNYTLQFETMTSDWKGTIRRFEFETELAFLLTRGEA